MPGIFDPAIFDRAIFDTGEGEPEQPPPIYSYSTITPELPPPGKGSDIRIVSHHDFPRTVADWLLLPTGELDTSESLANLIKVALMTDALADVNEVLPDPDSTDRRGWWGDFEAETIWNGWPIGCKNWLLSRAKISTANSSEGSTVIRAEEYTRQALQPLISHRYCTYIDVQAARDDVERIVVRVTVYRGPKPEIQLLFQDLWDEIVDR